MVDRPRSLSHNLFIVVGEKQWLHRRKLNLEVFFLYFSIRLHVVAKLVARYLELHTNMISLHSADTHKTMQLPL